MAEDEDKDRYMDIPLTYLYKQTRTARSHVTYARVLSVTTVTVATTA